MIDTDHRVYQNAVGGIDQYISQVANIHLYLIEQDQKIYI